MPDIAELTRAVECNPKDPEALFAMARADRQALIRDLEADVVSRPVSLELSSGVVDIPATGENPDRCIVRIIERLRACLALAPDHAPAKALLGLTLIENNAGLAEAANLLAAAAEADPTLPEPPLGSGILALIGGNLAVAADALTTARELNPGDRDARLFAALADHAAQPTEALPETISETDGDGWMRIAWLMGMALRFPGLPEAAAQPYRAIAFTAVSKLAELAVACMVDDDLVSRAGRYLNQVVGMTSELPDVDLAAGLILFHNAELEMAEMAFVNALARGGIAELPAKMLELSLFCQDKAPRLPEHRAKLTDADFDKLGLVYCESLRLAEAEAVFRKTVANNPDDLRARRNLSESLAHQGKLEAALACAEELNRMAPDNAIAQSQLASLYLSNRRLDKAWPLNEGRLSHFRANTAQPAPPVPRWTDQPLDGKTLLIWREEGIGDELRLSTCLPDAIRAWPCKIVYDCAPKLAELYARTFPEIVVRPELGARSDFSGIDYHLPMGSLPMHFRADLAAFPASGKHLLADPELAENWRRRLAELGPKPKIGVCWRSLNTSWNKRSLLSQPADWGPVFGVSNADFINLQIRPTADEFAAIETDFGVTLHNFDDLDLKDDIDNAAALVAGLDAVITARCWMMLFAGGLGVKTYVFSSRPNSNMMELPYDPWFPDTEVFYRDYGEPWDGSMTAIADRLTHKFGETT